MNFAAGVYYMEAIKRGSYKQGRGILAVRLKDWSRPEEASGLAPSQGLPYEFCSCQSK
jgi:hypothetical protein